MSRLVGFIPGSRASLTIDLLAASMLLVVPMLTTALVFARRRRYLAHKRTQLALSTLLLVVIALFEIEVRRFGWIDLAAASPYYDSALRPVLAVHLTAAITTTLLWTVTLVLALRRFPSPPKPGPHSAQHRRLARCAALGMYLTSVTGWTFFWVAFVA